MELKRNEIPVEQTWSLDDLFKSNEEFKAALPNLEKMSDQISIYEGKMLENANTLYSCLNALELFSIEANKMGNYAYLNTSTDATNTKAQENAMVFRGLGSKLGAKTVFIDAELMEITTEQLDAFIKEEPRLVDYKKMILDTIEKKKFKLQPETEKVLASLDQVLGAPYNVYSVSKAADMIFDNFIDGKKNEVANSFNLFEGMHEQSENREIRKNAYESFNNTLKQYNNTYAGLYNAEVNKQVTMAKLRGYNDVFEMLLEPQEVTKEMYNRQIDVIYKELAPHMRKYAALLQDELDLDTVRFYDLKAPIDPKNSPDAKYGEVKQLILDSLAIMGEDYLAIINRAFDERWIDYAQNQGKGTGAFCSSPYGVHPYVFITFQDKMRDALVLAHELGHAGHGVLANNAQPFFNTRSSMYAIEAPSTMNELLVGNHMLKTTEDNDVKKFVISSLLSTYYHNFVTHLLEAHYQRNVYELAEQGAPLTAQTLNNLKLDTLKGFWGDSVEIDDDAGMTWMRQPHYYMGLYPYTYSAGLTASTAIAAKIFSGDTQAITDWLEYLKLGGSRKPLELFKAAGMDLSTDKPVQDAVAYVGSLIDQLIELSK